MLIYNYTKQTLKNARKIILKTKCDAVKLEGGAKIFDIIKTLISNKIPVMGHLGLLPQSATKFKAKGKKISERNNLLNDAKILDSLGVFSIVLECIESSLAKEITKNISIPTIGIGASVNCDGQVLVTDDLIGLNFIKARFVKRFTNITKQINTAIINYKNEVKNKKFPKKANSY